MVLFSVKDLNEIAQSSSRYLGLNALKIGYPYKVFGFQLYDRSSFKSKSVGISVTIENGYLCLPERFDGLMDEVVSSGTDNLCIIYNGRETRGIRWKIHFERKKPSKN